MEVWFAMATDLQKYIIEKLQNDYCFIVGKDSLLPIFSKHYNIDILIIAPYTNTDPNYRVRILDTKTNEIKTFALVKKKDLKQIAKTELLKLQENLRINSDAAKQLTDDELANATKHLIDHMVGISITKNDVEIITVEDNQDLENLVEIFTKAFSESIPSAEENNLLLGYV